MAKFMTLLLFCFLLVSPTAYSAVGGGGTSRGGGESSLQMDRFEDVKKVYMELFEDFPREYADQLMGAMQKWDKQSA